MYSHSVFASVSPWGKVDEVRVWGAALRPEHLVAFSSLSGNAVRAAHPFAALLAAYYRFNEGNGTAGKVHAIILPGTRHVVHRP